MGVYSGWRRIRVILDKKVPGVKSPVLRNYKSVADIAGHAAEKMITTSVTSKFIFPWIADKNHHWFDAALRKVMSSPTNSTISSDFERGPMFAGYEVDKWPSYTDPNDLATVVAQYCIRQVPHSSLVTFFNILAKSINGGTPTGSESGESKKFWESYSANWTTQSGLIVVDGHNPGEVAHIKVVSNDVDDGESPIFLSVFNQHIPQDGRGEQMLWTFHFSGPRGTYTTYDETTNKNFTFTGTGYYVLVYTVDNHFCLYEQVKGRLMLVKKVLVSTGGKFDVTSLVIYRRKATSYLPGFVCLGFSNAPVKADFNAGPGNEHRGISGTIAPGNGKRSETQGHFLIEHFCTETRSPMQKCLAFGCAPYLTNVACRFGYAKFPTGDETETQRGQFSRVYDHWTKVGWPVGKDNSSARLTIRFFGQIPEGCEIICEVYTDQGEKLTRESTTGRGTTQVYKLNTANLFTAFRTIITLKSSADGKSYPIYSGYDYSLQGIYNDLTPDIVYLPSADGEITDFVPYSDDPDNVRCTYSFTARTTEATILKTREVFSCKIQVSFNAPGAIAGRPALSVLEPVGVETGVTWHTIFSGVTVNVLRRELSRDMTRYTLELKSPWVLVKDAILLARESLLKPDQDGPVGRVVTRVMKDMLEISGFDSSYHDFVTNTTQVAVSADTPAPFLFAGKSCAEVILELKDTYLAERFFWDHCTEKWRTVLPTKRNAAYKLVIGDPQVDFAANTKYAGFMIKPYYSVGEMAAANKPIIPWLKGSNQNNIIKPEFNHLIVTGVGIAASPTEVPTVYGCEWYNKYSMDLNINGKDWTVDESLKGPDWIGYIKNSDAYIPALAAYPKISGDEGPAESIIKVVTRRIAEYAGHGISINTRTIPVPFFPHESDPTKFRTLRWDDPIALVKNGDTYIVRDVQFHTINKSSMMLMDVESLRILRHENVIWAE